MPRRVGAWMAGLASALLALCAFAPSAVGAQLRGFNDTALGQGHVPRSLFLNRLSDSGARVHRVEMSWQSYEPERDRYNPWFWTRPDADYRDELARGVKQLIVLQGTPYWALTPEGRGATSPGGVWRCDGGDTPCNAPPNVRDPTIKDAWSRWVKTVVARYPQAAGIEVWNEPNIRWSWFQRQDPDLYALMLKSAAEAVRAVNPSMPVISGSVSTFSGVSDLERTDYRQFLDAVYRVAGKSSFSGIGLHAYACKFQGTFHAIPERHVGILRDIKAAHGDSAKGLWLTETGATTGRPSEATCNATFTEREQRDAIADILDWAASEQARTNDLPVVLVNSLFDTPTDPLGLLGSNGFGVLALWRNPLTGGITVRAKPSYAALRCRFRGGC